MELSELLEFAEYKKKTGLLSDLFYGDEVLHSVGENLSHCGDFLDFSNGQLVSANFCRERLCPMCQRRKALSVYAKTISLVKSLDDFNFLHLTLTIINCDALSLSDTITKLFKASSRLFAKKEVKTAFKGVFRALEVTFNGNSYHPHLHCIVAVRPSYFKSRYYLKTEKIRELWKECLKVDYLPQCWVEKCDGRNIESAVAEVAKYCVKPLDISLPPREILGVYHVLYKALKGRRLIQLYGVFRAKAKELNISDIEILELESRIGLLTIEKYVYNRSVGVYEKLTDFTV